MTKTITVASMEKTGTFYLAGNAGFYEEAHLVTDQAHNAELGIKHIGLTAVESTKPNAPLFRVSLKLIGGIRIYGDIFRQSNGTGLRFNGPQEKYVDEAGESKYADKVSIPQATVAQILRYASTFTKEVEATSVPQPSVTVQPQAETSTVQQSAPAPKTDTPAVNDLTMEQLQAFLARANV